jgi:hypothetical protein
MAFPQGIYFRATDNQSDPSDYDAEIYSAGGGGSNYPRTSAQGNSVGWEAIVNQTLVASDRDAGAVIELNGIAQIANNTNNYADYRIALPSTGDYIIRLALGDASNGQSIRVRLYDDVTEFEDIEGGTSGASKYLDATGVERTSQADWVSNNAAITRTFASTIFRLRLGEHSGNTGNSAIAAIYIESSGEAQLLAPASDISAGTWLPSAGSPAELWQMIDGEKSPDTDYDYTTSAGTMEVKFASGSTPSVQTGHTIRYRLRGNGTCDALVKLKVGTTVLAQWTETNVPAVDTDYSHTLDSSPSFTISDYSDLRISVEAIP